MDASDIETGIITYIITYITDIIKVLWTQPTEEYPEYETIRLEQAELGQYDIEEAS